MTLGGYREFLMCNAFVLKILQRGQGDELGVGAKLLGLSFPGYG